MKQFDWDAAQRELEAAVVACKAAGTHRYNTTCETCHAYDTQPSCEICPEHMVGATLFVKKVTDNFPCPGIWVCDVHKEEGIERLTAYFEREDAEV